MRLIDSEGLDWISTQELSEHHFIARIEGFLQMPSYNGIPCVIHKRNLDDPPPKYQIYTLNETYDYFGRKLQEVRWKNLKPFPSDSAHIVIKIFENLLVDLAEITREMMSSRTHIVATAWRAGLLKFLVPAATIPSASSSVLLHADARVYVPSALRCIGSALPIVLQVREPLFIF